VRNGDWMSPCAKAVFLISVEAKGGLVLAPHGTLEEHQDLRQGWAVLA